MNQPEEEDWDIELKPNAGLFDLHMRDVWHYRDLLILFVRRDFVSFYKQTILGPVWFFIQPVITIIFYSFVFGNLASIPTDGIPQPLFYLAGIILWNYFSDCLSKTSTVFRDGAGLMSKVYFPRLIMPLSIVASNLIRFAVQIVLFVALIGLYAFKGAHFHLSGYIILFPFLVLLIAALGLGLGMIISAVTTKYRDIAFVVSFGVPLLMYTTTVVYPLSVALVKFPRYSWVVKYNPITGIIEAFRFACLGKGTFSFELLGYCTLVTLAILFAGILTFNRVEKTFVDTV